MKRWRLIVFLFVGTVIAAGLFAKREPLMLAWLAANIEKTDIAARQRLLESAMEVRLPTSGEPPFPVVLQFHGCAGKRDAFQDYWADIANEAGYAAMIVDSHGPRGFSREAALEIICAGKALIGQERAGDVLAAIRSAEENPNLDASRLVLAGWSHGAWSVMDFLTMDLITHAPAGLDLQDTDLPDLSGVLLFYPYCGIGTLSRFRNPAHTPKSLVFVAGADEIVDPKQCTRHFERRKEKGDPLDVIVYPEARHAFDDQFLEPEWLFLYNEEYARDAAENYGAFLSELSHNGP